MIKVLKIKSLIMNLLEIKLKKNQIKYNSFKNDEKLKSHSHTLDNSWNWLIKIESDVLGEN